MLFQKFYGVTLFEWIILIILIIIAIVYLISQIFSPNLKNYINKYNHILSWVDLDSFLSNANNGDLIFLCGNTRGEKSCRWWSNSIYSHVGMLFREIHSETNEDILYIWESDLGQGSKDGPRLLKLTDKLKRYHGYPYLMWKQLICSNENKPSTENIMKVVHKFKEYEFDNYMLSWISSIFKRKNYMFCSELIAETLTDENIKILNKEKYSYEYSPESFASSRIALNLNHGYVYSNGNFINFSNFKKS